VPIYEYSITVEYSYIGTYDGPQTNTPYFTITVTPNTFTDTVPNTNTFTATINRFNGHTAPVDIVWQKDDRYPIRPTTTEWGATINGTVVDSTTGNTVVNNAPDTFDIVITKRWAGSPPNALLGAMYVIGISNGVFKCSNDFGMYDSVSTFGRSYGYILDRDIPETEGDKPTNDSAFLSAHPPVIPCYEQTSTVTMYEYIQRSKSVIETTAKLWDSHKTQVSYDTIESVYLGTATWFDVASNDTGIPTFEWTEQLSPDQIGPSNAYIRSTEVSVTNEYVYRPTPFYRLVLYNNTETVSAITLLPEVRRDVTISLSIDGYAQEFEYLNVIYSGNIPVGQNSTILPEYVYNSSLYNIYMFINNIEQPDITILPGQSVDCRFEIHDVTTDELYAVTNTVSITRALDVPLTFSAYVPSQDLTLYSGESIVLNIGDTVSFTAVFDPTFGEDTWECYLQPDNIQMTSGVPIDISTVFDTTNYYPLLTNITSGGSVGIASIDITGNVP